METNTITPSVSVTLKPQDSRCRYWAKIIRASDPLPLPSAIDGANTVPGPYLRQGEEELFPFDVLITGEARHHVKAKGWNYELIVCLPDGSKKTLRPCVEHKAEMKTAGCPAEWLPGSGEIASLVRCALGYREGYLS